LSIHLRLGLPSGLLPSGFLWFALYLTLWSWAQLERSLVVLTQDSFPAFYGTRRFNTKFTRACVSPIELSWIVGTWPLRLNSSQDSRRLRSDGPQSSVGFVESRNFCEAHVTISERQSRVAVGPSRWQDTSIRQLFTESYWVRWFKCNVADLYLGSDEFESRQGHRLSWLMNFVVFLSRSGQVSGYSIKLGYEGILPHLT
jgi:hypothetical protein